MKEFKYTINDPLGIHARPAGLFAKQATCYQSSITISKDDKEVDAKRIIAVMSLGVKKGQEITVKADGADEEAAIEGLKRFLEENL